MSSKKWLALVIATCGTLCASVASYDYYRDFYGLFRNPRNRLLIPYYNERTTKFLFGYRYVPQNFDALLVGSSITDNWDTSKISGFRVYNGSISGGNISEAKLVEDNVLRHGGLRLVIFCVYPYLTETFGRKSGYMNPREYWGSLGSIQLFQEYWHQHLVNSGREKLLFHPDGYYDFQQEAGALPPDELAAAFERPPTGLQVDSSAYTEFDHAVQEARNAGAQVAYFFPPINYYRWSARKQEYVDYKKKMQALFRPDELFIDFNDPRYDTFRKDKSNFFDGSHLTKEASALMVSELNRYLGQTNAKNQ